MSEEQAGFRKGRGTTDQIFVIRQLSEKYIEQNRTLYNNFIDYKQAFDSVWQEGLWRVMRYCGIPEELVTLILACISFLLLYSSIGLSADDVFSY